MESMASKAKCQVFVVGCRIAEVELKTKYIPQ